MEKRGGRPKYYTIMEQIKVKITSGKIQPGEKIPSENKLVEIYKVSRHTIRKALALLVNDGYVEAIHGKGTFCSQRMLHTKNSRNIAVVTTYISDYIFPWLIQGIDQVLSENGYSIILKNTGNSRQKEARYLEELLAKDIAGLIIEPSKSQLLCIHSNLYDLLDQYEIPYIFIQGIYEQMQDRPHILMNDCQGGYLVTKHLLDLGHRHIVGIFKADDYQGKERHKGYVKALQEAGHAYDPDMVIWYHTEDRKKKPYVMIQQMLNQGILIEGIVCYNDLIAVQVIEHLKSRGIRVPEDISVTGYDNSTYSNHGGIGLTTIAHPQEKLGEMAAELLLEQINGVSPERSKINPLIEPHLIVRNSCQNNKKYP